MSVDRWSERDARRIAARFTHIVHGGGWPDGDELTYLRGMAMWLLLSGQLDEYAADAMRRLIFVTEPVR